MSAAAMFTPGAGDFHIPVTVRLADLPRGQQLAAWRVYSAILDFLPRGKTELDGRYTDRILRQSPWLRDYSPRFIQKGLKILTDLGIIRRQFSEGHRIIIVTGRLRGRPNPATAAGDRAGAGTGSGRPATRTAARPASIPNVGVIPPATPEQLAAAAAAQEIDPGPPPSAEDQAAAEEIFRQSRARREAADKAKARADARGRNRAGTAAASTTRDPNSPGMTAQAILEARRQAAGLRITPGPDPGPAPGPDPDPDPGSPPRRAGP